MVRRSLAGAENLCPCLVLVLNRHCDLTNRQSLLFEGVRGSLSPVDVAKEHLHTVCIIHFAASVPVQTDTFNFSA
jgi:hypothetical protein